MKAYIVQEQVEYLATVVFAETAGQAKSLALHTDACQDREFTEIRARREKQLDQYYDGSCWELDFWNNDTARLILVKELGWSCDPEYSDIDECEECIAKDYCGSRLFI